MNPTTRKYFPQIDALRAFAMIAVVFFHTWQEDEKLNGARVTLFFVISSFLMTNILLRHAGASEWRLALRYYLRRALRLLPALLIFIILSSMVNSEFRGSFAFHLLQATNLYFAITDQWTPWVANHVWSLNVLEQYYIAWPLIILFFSRRTSLSIVLTVLAVTGIMSFLTDHLWPEAVANHVLPHSWGVPIAAGALVSYWFTTANAPRWPSHSAWAVSGIFLSLVPLIPVETSEPLRRLFFTAGATMLLIGAVVGYSGVLGRAMNSPIAKYLSTISYGVFMYHLLVWSALGKIFPMERGPLTFACVTIVSGVFASVSWHFVEEPIARWKRLVPLDTSPSNLASRTKLPSA